ncbi:MAG TPA: transporter [Silvibacterium sp.]|nr:transporter [Silvibacterium sp.]
MRLKFVWMVALLAAAVAELPAAGQDLEPRAYSASPVGTTFLQTAFGGSTGSVVFDPTIPITNVHATFYNPAVAASYTFGMLGRQALFSAGLPYVWGNATGDVGAQSGKIYRSGLADMRLRFSINLRGAPALSPAEFAKAHRTSIVGASVTVVAPSGQYGNTKLVNIGSNRWAFKPEIGFSYPVKRFFLDAYAGAWFFTTNDAYYPGTAQRSQEPLTALQGHVSYTVRPGLWAAFDATWYGGGAVSTNGGPETSRQSNSRLGGTLSLPLTKRQSIKVAYSSGVTATVGGKFNSWTVSWQRIWFR